VNRVDQEAAVSNYGEAVARSMHDEECLQARERTLITPAYNAPRGIAGHEVAGGLTAWPMVEPDLAARRRQR
jgi:hypothetical protein